MIQFSHHLMSGPKEQIPAMNRVKHILKEANFTNRVFPMCIGYASWETDEVISEELYRNVLLAITCVFITTWLLLFNFSASIQAINLSPLDHFYHIQILGSRLRHFNSDQCRGIYPLLGTDDRHGVLHQHNHIHRYILPDLKHSHHLLVRSMCGLLGPRGPRLPRKCRDQGRESQDGTDRDR